MSENTNNKPNTITAAEWPTVADAVLTNRATVWDGNTQVFDIVERQTKDVKVYLVYWTDAVPETISDEEWRFAMPHDRFAVRWLADTAPQAANDSAAEWGPVQTIRWGGAGEWIDTDDHETLKAQRDELKRQLAAAWESIAEARKYIAQLFDHEQRFDMEKGKRFTTETLNFSDSALANAQDVVGGKVAPPAPDVSALAAAVQQVISLAPSDRPEYPEIPDNSDDVPAKYLVKDFEVYGMTLAYWRVKLLLEAALKAGE